VPTKSVFDQDIVSLARWLVGAHLLVRGVGGIILETEAYGRDDPASHSFRGPGLRNAAMFGAAGSVYVYLSYGCHLCLNIVGRPGEAVLIRAIRPVNGLDVMAARRGRGPGASDIGSGPGRVGQALGIRLADNGAPVGLRVGSPVGSPVGPEGFVLTRPHPPSAPLLVGPRIGISRAADLPWRFGLPGATGLSRPFPPRT